MSSDPQALAKFVIFGTAGQPTYNDPALADYHPPADPDDRRDYLTESVIAKDTDGWHVKLLLSGRWHRSAKQITRGLRFVPEGSHTLVAKVSNQDDILADGWQLDRYRLALPDSDTADDVVMTGYLDWSKNGQKLTTSWIWEEKR